MPKRLLSLVSMILIVLSTVTSCVTTSNYSPEMSYKINSIMVTTVIPSQKYRILGTVTIKTQELFATGINPELANNQLKIEAFNRYGNSVDAIIGVQYSEVRGILYNSLLGTRATGTVIHYTE